MEHGKLFLGSFCFGCTYFQLCVTLGAHVMIRIRSVAGGEAAWGGAAAPPSINGGRETVIPGDSISVTALYSLKAETFSTSGGHPVRFIYYSLKARI